MKRAAWQKKNEGYGYPDPSRSSRSTAATRAGSETPTPKIVSSHCGSWESVSCIFFCMFWSVENEPLRLARHAASNSTGSATPAGMVIVRMDITQLDPWRSTFVMMSPIFSL